MNVVREDQYDLVVCGGGPAGFACAVSAARCGLAVALIERGGCLGGTATLAGVNHLLAGRKLDENTGEHVRVVGGIFDELTDHLIRDGSAIEPNTIDPNFNPFGWYPRMASGIAFDDTAIKIAMDDFCQQAGVRVYYHTVLTEAEVSGNNISSVVVWNKDGFVRIRATYFADCTGDADLAALSGCSYSKGRNEDGRMTPCSTEMHVDHVDTNAFVTYQNKHNSPKLVEIIEGLKEKGIWNFPYEIFVTVRMVQEDVFMVNTIRQIGIDGTSEVSVSKALADGRKENVHLFNIMKEYFPGFQNARIRKMADYLGVRETRRIHGLCTVTIEDALSGKHYEDTVAATTYNFDLPDPLRPSYDPMMGDAKKPHARRKHVVIRIPYRSLLPKEMNNLIVAGRCISAEREVLGPIRIMGPCMMMGQAAGIASAMAKEHSCWYSAVPTKELRNNLWAAGVINPDTLPFD